MSVLPNVHTFLNRKEQLRVIIIVFLPLWELEGNFLKRLKSKYIENQHLLVSPRLAVERQRGFVPCFEKRKARATHFYI